MFAYVKLRQCGKCLIVNEKQIRHFDSKNINFQKFYKVKLRNEFKDASIAYCKESKEELEQLIASKRASVPPLKRMYSTSDISEEDRRKKTLLDIDNTRKLILSRRMFDLEKNFTKSKLEKSHEEVGRFCTSERNAKAPPLNAVDNEKSHEEVGRFCTSERNARTEESRNSPRMSEYINLKLQIKEWQSKCLGMEKRLQASQERTKFLTKKNQELQEMLTETTKLNMDLQRHVINFFEQSEDIEAAKHDTQQNLLQNFPSVGFLRKSDSMIHVGQGLWLPKGTYDAVVYNARKSKRIFVKNMSLALFGPEILKNSSVEGRVSNRRKNSSPKSPLDPVKLRAITDIFQHYLELLKCSSVEIDLWLRRVGSIISSKISDLNRPPRSKKSDHTAEEMDDDEQEKNYQQENYQQENYQQEDCDQENYQQEDCDQENYQQEDCDQENYQQEDCEQNSEQGKNDEENHKDDEFIYEFLDTNLSNSVN